MQDTEQYSKGGNNCKGNQKEDLLQACRDFDFDNKGYIPLINFITLAKKQGIILDSVAGSKSGTFAIANLCDKRGRINYQQLINNLEHIQDGRDGKWILSSLYTPYSTEANFNNGKAKESIINLNENDLKQAAESKIMDTQNFNNQTADEALVMISELENKVEDKMLPPAHPSSIQPKKISKDIQKLSKMLKKDNFNKENLHMLRTFFCSCQFSEDGLATASEYESVVSKANTSLSKLTLDQIIKMITVPNDKLKISYFKLKSLIRDLEEDQLYFDLHSSSQIKQVFNRGVESIRKIAKTDQDEIMQI